VVQVGEVIKFTLLFPENVVLSVGRPVIFGTAAHNCLVGPHLNRRLMLVVWVWTVGILRNEPAIKEQSLVASACEQGNSDYGIASLFDCVMPSVNGCGLDEPKVDSVIFQNNTVSINAEAPVSFVTAGLSSLKYVDICLSGDDSRDVKHVSALCHSGAEICVANSSVVEGLNLDPIGQIQLRPFCGNTVTADLVCLNVSLADLCNVTPNQVLKITCAMVPDLYHKFILTADVIDRLSRCDIVVSQAQVNGAVNSSANVDDNRDDINASNATHASVKDDVAVLHSPVTNDDVTVVNDQNDVECDNVNEDCDDVTEGGTVPTSDCSLSSSAEVAKEQRDDPSLTGCWKLADKGRAGFVVKDNLLYHRTKILGQDVY